MPRKKRELEPTEHAGVYKTPEGFLVRARAVDHRTGRSVSHSRLVSGSLREALRVQAEMVATVQDRGRVKRTRLASYAASWLERKRSAVSVATLERYAIALEDHILPFIGDWYIDALTPDAILEWRDTSEKRTYEKRDGSARVYNPRTVNGWLRVLQALLDDAFVELRLGPSPASRIVALPEPHPYTDEDPNVLTPEELGRVLVSLRETSPAFYPLLCTMALTGLRTSEATALRRADYDREAGVLLVQRSAVRGNVRARTKTGASRRVPVPQALVTVLRQHLERIDEEARIESVRRGEIVRPSEWLFPSDTGAPRYGTTLSKPLRAAVTAAGIKTRLTPHGLRRSVNDALRALASADVQKAITGHSTERMREHYSHVRVEERREAIELVSAAVRRHREPAT